MASILVIENRDVLRALFHELLERAGHVVQEASQGLEGIRQYRRSPTDLVITDIHLPDYDGLEVVVTLGQESAAVKILVVSGKSGEHDALLTAKL
jgi:CheY-like chemotaxis protein